jgi:hypothetical protein
MVKSVVDPWGWQHDRSLRLENLEFFRELPSILPRVLRSRVDRRFELLRSLILLRNTSSIGELFRGAKPRIRQKIAWRLVNFSRFDIYLKIEMRRSDRPFRQKKATERSPFGLILTLNLIGVEPCEIEGGCKIVVADAQATFKSAIETFDAIAEFGFSIPRNQISGIINHRFGKGIVFHPIDR